MSRGTRVGDIVIIGHDHEYLYLVVDVTPGPPPESLPAARTVISVLRPMKLDPVDHTGKGYTSSWKYGYTSVFHSRAYPIELALYGVS